MLHIHPHILATMAHPGDNKRFKTASRTADTDVEGTDDEGTSSTSFFEVDGQTLSLADILSKCNKETAAIVAAQNASLSAELSKTIETVAKSFDERSEKRFGKMEGEIEDLRVSQRRFEKENQEIRDSIKSLSGELEVAEKKAAEGISDTQLARDNFHGKPEPNILVIRTHFLTSLDEIKKSTEKKMAGGCEPLGQSQLYGA